VKAGCALEGISVNKKLHDLLAREYLDALEPVKRRRRQPSQVAQIAQMEGAEG
jgi:hypothetical protein